MVIMEDQSQNSASNELNTEPTNPPSDSPSSSPANDQTNTPSLQPQPAVSQPTANKSKRLLGRIVILIVVAVIAVGAVLYGNHKKNQQTASGKQDIQLIRYGFDNNPLNTFWPSD